MKSENTKLKRTFILIGVLIYIPGNKNLVSYSHLYKM